MKTYEYRGLSRDGRASRGLIEAFSIKDARSRLSSDGILVERIDNFNKFIAYELGISVGTVGTLLARPSRKLGARSRADLISSWRAREIEARSG